MNSNILKISLFLALFSSIFPIKTADDPYLYKAFCKAQGVLTSQRSLDLQFLIAVFNDDVDKAIHLHKCGANINAINNYSDQEARHIINQETPFGMSLNNSALMLAKSFKMIKYLINNGANVNYEFLCGPIRCIPTCTHPYTTLENIIYKSINKNDDPRIAIAVLRAGAKPTEEIIEYIKTESTPTAKAILNFIKNPRAKKIYETIENFPKDLTKLISEYEY